MGNATSWPWRSSAAGSASDASSDAADDAGSTVQMRVAKVPSAALAGDAGACASVCAGMATELEAAACMAAGDADAADADAATARVGVRVSVLDGMLQ